MKHLNGIIALIWFAALIVHLSANWSDPDGWDLFAAAANGWLVGFYLLWWLEDVFRR